MKIRNGFISNSSSSCFILNAYSTSEEDKNNLSTEQIHNILETMINFYNSIFDSKLCFTDVFEEPSEITVEFIEETLVHYLSRDRDEITDEKKIKKLNHNKSKCKNKYKSVFKLKDKNKLYVSETDYQDENSGLKWFEIDISDYVGKIMILSAEDNSIPYELHDTIERRFNATRMHLG